MNGRLTKPIEREKLGELIAELSRRLTQLQPAC
jgi:hypothetical protein